MSTTKTYKIGEQAQGGIVLWVTESGEHGIAVANKDQGSFVLSEAKRRVGDIANLHDEDGKQFKNWRVPTQEEVNYMYENLYKAGLGGFANDMLSGYWCVNDFSLGAGLIFKFGSGKWLRTDKNNSRLLRAVRNF